MTAMTELRDLRASISVTADQVLEAMARATDSTKQELVRKVLDDWAAQKIHEATMIQRLAPGDGKSRSATE